MRSAVDERMRAMGANGEHRECKKNTSDHGIEVMLSICRGIDCRLYIKIDSMTAPQK